jgi:hypothetical protein
MPNEATGGPIAPELREEALATPSMPIMDYWDAWCGFCTERVDQIEEVCEANDCIPLIETVDGQRVLVGVLGPKDAEGGCKSIFHPGWAAFCQARGSSTAAVKFATEDRMPRYDDHRLTLIQQAIDRGDIDQAIEMNKGLVAWAESQIASATTAESLTRVSELGAQMGVVWQRAHHVLEQHVAEVGSELAEQLGLRLDDLTPESLAKLHEDVENKLAAMQAPM